MKFSRGVMASTSRPSTRGIVWMEKCFSGRIIFKTKSSVGVDLGESLDAHQDRKSRREDPGSRYPRPGCGTKRLRAWLLNGAFKLR